MPKILQEFKCLCSMGQRYEGEVEDFYASLIIAPALTQKITGTLDNYIFNCMFI